MTKKLVNCRNTQNKIQRRKINSQTQCSYQTHRHLTCLNACKLKQAILQLHPRVTFPNRVFRSLKHRQPRAARDAHGTADHYNRRQRGEWTTDFLPRLVCPFGKNPYCTQLKSPRILPTASPSWKCTPSLGCCPVAFPNEKVMSR